MLDIFKSDYRRMTGRPYRPILSRLETSLHHELRYVYWLRRRQKNPSNRIAGLMLFLIGRKYGLEIGTTEIGPGLYLGHPYNITISRAAKLGKNINIHKGATIGRENRGRRSGAPVIGDNVWIGINAVIVGGIQIGNDVMIAPNSYVNFDVPDHSVVIGNPGVIHSKEEATKGYI